MWINRYTSTIEAHGCIVLQLSNGVAAPAPSFTYYIAAAAGNTTLGGGANTRVVSSSVTVVGFVGNGGTLTISGVDGGTAGGTKLLALDYINGDYVFGNTNCSNCRYALISVNGGASTQVQLPISGQVSTEPPFCFNARPLGKQRKLRHKHGEIT